MKNILYQRQIINGEEVMVVIEEYEVENIQENEQTVEELQIKIEELQDKLIEIQNNLSNL